MKFHTPSDFIRALHILRDLGLPITETPPSTTSNVEPSASPATSMFSSVSASSSVTVGNSLSRPSSMQDSPRTFGRHLPSPPRAEFKVPMLPDTFSSDCRRPSSAQPYAVAPMIKSSPIITPARSSSALAPGLHEAVRQPPSLYVSQVEREVSTITPAI